MRELVRVVLFFRLGCEGSLDDIRSQIDDRYASGCLPSNWKIQVRDVLKHDPDIEKTEDGTWLLRSPGDIQA